MNPLPKWSNWVIYAISAGDAANLNFMGIKTLCHIQHPYMFKHKGVVLSVQINAKQTWGKISPMANFGG